MSELAAPSLRLARTLRKAITERDDTLRAALELYDNATSEMERYDAATELMLAIPKADGRYEAIRDQAARDLRQADEQASG